MGKAAVYLGKTIISRLLGLFLYALGAGWSVNARAWAYFALYICVTVAMGLSLLGRDPDTLAERDKIGPETPRWDRIILLLYWLLSFFGIYWMAGLEAQPALTPDLLFWTGLLLCLLSACLQFAAIRENTFMESSARIQTDRDQTVVDSGVYRVVRHPVYSAILLWCVAISLVFPTRFVWLAAAVCAALIVVRTGLEDKMLRENLPGYSAYAQRTRRRLVPGVW